MKNLQEMVREFHVAVNHPVSDTPIEIEDKRRLLRAKLVMEEAAEVIGAILGMTEEETKERLKQWWGPDVEDEFEKYVQEMKRPSDMVRVAWNTADLHIIASGTAVEYGYTEEPIIAEIHAANMRKVGGGYREDGKVKRPGGWEPPEIERLLREDGWRG